MDIDLAAASRANANTRSEVCAARPFGSPLCQVRGFGAAESAAVLPRFGSCALAPTKSPLEWNRSARVEGATPTSGRTLRLSLPDPDPGATVKVTVDTRHDSLDEALATVRAAFGSGGGSFNDGDRPSETPDVVGANAAGA